MNSRRPLHSEFQELGILLLELHPKLCPSTFIDEFIYQSRHFIYYFINDSSVVTRKKSNLIPTGNNRLNAPEKYVLWMFPNLV